MMQVERSYVDRDSSGVKTAVSHAWPDVLLVFLSLGVTSFGGPVAHLGYFRRAFVERRKWLSEAEYSAIIGLCQFLPGPASSQTGFCIGLRRAGWRGGVAAWVGFTLPSAVLMWLLARHTGWFEQDAAGRGLLHGLQLAAVAVVAQAVWVMARSLCPDAPRRAMAVLAALAMFLLPGGVGQAVVILGGALTGWGLFGAVEAPAATMAAPELRRAGMICLLIFTILLAASCFAKNHGDVALFAAFYRTGALVFGGGHVVLPLLQQAVVQKGFVSQPIFLAGYGAAQAMPGPLFTVAAYLGAAATGGSVAGAAIALVSIFLPGLLLVAGIWPFWQVLSRNKTLGAALQGINAAVVGLLAAAELTLIHTGAIANAGDAIIVIIALTLLITKTKPILVVALCALTSTALTFV